MALLRTKSKILLRTIDGTAIRNVACKIWNVFAPKMTELSRFENVSKTKFYGGKKNLKKKQKKNTTKPILPSDFVLQS